MAAPIPMLAPVTNAVRFFQRSIPTSKDIFIQVILIMWTATEMMVQTDQVKPYLRVSHMDALEIVNPAASPFHNRTALQSMNWL